MRPLQCAPGVANLLQFHIMVVRTTAKAPKKKKGGCAIIKACCDIIMKATAMQKKITKGSSSKKRSKVKEKKGTSKKRSTVDERGGIYVLELDEGCVYVGKSSNIQRRLQQHMNVKGAFFRYFFDFLNTIKILVFDIDVNLLLTTATQHMNMVGALVLSS